MATFPKCILLFLFISTLFFAQTRPKEEMKRGKINSTEKNDLPKAIGETITFNNSENNPLITITDEGNNAGSITLPPVAAMTSGINKLYNVGGILNFNGSALGTGSGVDEINDLNDAKYDGSSLFLGDGSGLSDDATSNANTAVGKNSLNKNTSGYYNTAIGRGTLANNTGGFSNSAFGHSAMANNTLGESNSALGDEALYSNNDGNWNTAIGYQSLYSNKDGYWNTAVGYQSLYSNSSAFGNTAVGNECLFTNNGGYNTAVGHFALKKNSTGNNNTAVGAASLTNSTTSSDNTAVGYWSLFLNTTGVSNCAFGSYALTTNTSGNYNTGFGDGAIAKNLVGDANTAMGYNALFNSIAERNTAFGFQSMLENIDGTRNTALGFKTLFYNNGNYNTAVGYGTLYANSSGGLNTAVGYSAMSTNATGSFNTAVGYNAGPNSDNLTNSIAVGYNAVTTASYQVRIGNSSITSIGGYQNWTNISDVRYKQNIREDVSGLDFIMKLRPITYNLNISAIVDILGEDMVIDKDGHKRKEQPSAEILDSRTTKASKRQSGFVAQEVEELADRIGYNFSGIDKPESDNGFYGLRYAEFVVPLVKAVQEQQKMIEELRAEIDVLKRK